MTVAAQLGGPKELRRPTASPDEIISMSKSLPFDEALEIFNGLSKKHLGKIIIDPTDGTEPIGVNVDNMHWLDAFELVMRANNLEYEELIEYILIKLPVEVGPGLEQLAEEELKKLFDTREVTISAVFFEGNMSKLNEIGTGWSFLTIFQNIILGDTLRDTTSFAAMTAGQNKVGTLQMKYHKKFGILDRTFDQVTSMFSILESHQLGEVIASPLITVMSGAEGNIQIGTDFSITVKDFAGNSVTDFINTGIIVTVKPEIIEVDTTTFIHLNISAQNSSGSSSERGITVNTLSATSTILLLDGEETMIGGLFTNDKAELRIGVPFLKDLPWWVFGLRYLFGYHTKSDIRKELVILMRADLLPSLKERIDARLRGSEDEKVLKRSREDFEKRLENYLEQMKAR